MRKDEKVVHYHWHGDLPHRWGKAIRCPVRVEAARKGVYGSLRLTTNVFLVTCPRCKQIIRDAVGETP